MRQVDGIACSLNRDALGSISRHNRWTRKVTILSPEPKRSLISPMRASGRAGISAIGGAGVPAPGRAGVLASEAHRTRRTRALNHLGLDREREAALLVRLHRADADQLARDLFAALVARSEERRVGKE